MEGEHSVNAECVQGAKKAPDKARRYIGWTGRALRVGDGKVFLTPKEAKRAIKTQIRLRKRLRRLHRSEIRSETIPEKAEFAESEERDDEAEFILEAKESMSGDKKKSLREK